MSNPHYIILYVDRPAASAAFYQNLLGKPPVESSSTFAMFVLDAGVMLGLWARDTVVPSAPARGVDGEIAISVKSADGVDSIHADWVNRGVKIVQSPCDLDFGRTFTACDPDGHRLRVFAPVAVAAAVAAE